MVITRTDIIPLQINRLSAMRDSKGDRLSDDPRDEGAVASGEVRRPVQGRRRGAGGSGAGGPRLPPGHVLLPLSRQYLPADAKRLVNIDSCAVWKSAALQHATGRAYARATVIPEAGTAAAAKEALARRVPAKAEIQATSTPTC